MHYLARKAGRAESFGALERLEPRMLLAAVAWDGEGMDQLWENPENWSNDTLPTAADDVTINMPQSNPEIRLRSQGGPKQIHSLISHESLSVEVGAALVVSTTGVVDSGAVLTLAGELQGGAWNTTQGVFRLGDGTLTDVTLTGTVLVNQDSRRPLLRGATRFSKLVVTGSSATLRLADQFTLADPIELSGGAQFETLVQFLNNGSIAPSGSIAVLAGNYGRVTFASLSNAGTLMTSSVNRQLRLVGSTLQNSGLIRAAVGVVSVEVAQLNNADSGQLRSDTGAALTIGSALSLVQAWTNQGTVNVQGGSLTINANWSASEVLPGFTRSGGTIDLIGGTITNTSHTWTFDDANGSWNLLSATIVGGAIVQQGSNRLVLTTSGGTLRDVNVSGDLLLGSDNVKLTLAGATRFTAARIAKTGATLTLLDGFVLHDTISAEGAGFSNRFLTINGTVTIATDGALVLAQGLIGEFQVAVGGSGVRLINQGLIRVTSPNHAMTIGIAAFDNFGTIQVDPNSTLRLQVGQWTDPGLININQGTLELRGSTSTVAINFAGFTRSGGAVNLNNLTINNAGQVFQLTPQTGDWNVIAGGGLTGGTYLRGIGPQLLFGVVAWFDFHDVAMLEGVLLPGGGIRLSGTTSYPWIRLAGNNASVMFSDGITLAVPISVEGVSDAIYALGLLTFAEDLTIQVLAGASLLVRGGTVVNEGTITVDNTGKGLFFDQGAFINAGLVQSLGGILEIAGASFVNEENGILVGTAGSQVSVAPIGTWSNFGSMSFTGTALELGGQWSTSDIDPGVFAISGGTASIVAGVLGNYGRTLLINQRLGNWDLRGGTILGGELKFTDGFQLRFWTGRLENLNVLQDIVLDTFGMRVTLAGETRFPQLVLSGSATVLQFGGNYVLRDTVLCYGAGQTGFRYIWPDSELQIAASGAIIVSPHLTVRLDAQNGTIVNSGLIEVGVGAEVDGVSNLTLTSTSVVRLHVGGTDHTQFGSLHFGKTVQLDGTLEIVQEDGYVPLVGDFQRLITSQANHTFGTFVSTVLPPSNSVVRFGVLYDASGVTLKIANVIDFNLDGQIDLEDYFLFFNAWDQQDKAVDLNGDGVADLNDFFLFFNLWDAG